MARAQVLFVLSLVLGMFAIAACVTASHDASESTTNDQGALIGGEAGLPYNSGALMIRSATSRCTGVMVSSNQVLTAAHCVVDELLPDGGLPHSLPDGGWEVPTQVSATIKADYQPDAGISFTNNEVYNGSSAMFATHVTHTDLSPDFQAYCSANKCPSNFSVTAPFPQDLAIVTLADTFPQSFGLASTPSSAAVFDAVTEVGYGCTQSLNTRDITSPTFKSAPAVILSPTGSVPAPFSVSNVTAFSQNYFLTQGVQGGGQASLCPGDSGGPLFKGALAPYTNVVGVNAYYFFPNSTGVSSVNVFARLDSPNATSFLSSIINKYGPSNPQSDVGAVINNGANPISSLFPVESVSLATPGTPGCTGVILTRNSVLTAAHCQVGPTTVAQLYYSTILDPDSGLPEDSGVGRHVPGVSIHGLSVTTPDGINCNPSDLTTYPASCFTTSGTTGAYHNADLAVLTLASDIPEEFMPALLGPRGLDWQDGGPSLSWWQVAAGSPTPINSQSAMEWAAVSYDPTTSAPGAGQGWFNVVSTYGEWNDSGGPLFQAPVFMDDAGVDAGFVMGDTVLLGIVSGIGVCPQGQLKCSFKDTITSATFPDNYDWLKSQGGSPVPQVATFGASE